jgi:hypothetical protein
MTQNFLTAKDAKTRFPGWLVKAWFYDARFFSQVKKMQLRRSELLIELVLNGVLSCVAATS